MNSNEDINSTCSTNVLEENSESIIVTENSVENIMISEEAVQFSESEPQIPSYNGTPHIENEPCKDISHKSEIADQDIGTGTLENSHTQILDSHPEPAVFQDLGESVKKEYAIPSAPPCSENSSKEVGTCVDTNSITNPMDISLPVELPEASVINIKTEDPVGTEKESRATETDSTPMISTEIGIDPVKNADSVLSNESNQGPTLEPSIEGDGSGANPDVEMTPSDQPIYWPYNISDEFLKQDRLTSIATTIKDEFKGRNLKGCKWAPDGSCLLSNSDDNILRLYNLPQSVYQIEDWNDAKPLEEDTSWTPALSVREGGQIYDYEWFPLMSSSDSISACFLSTAADGPVHLWDAFTASLRASYLAYNQYDEVTTAYSVAFDPYGEKVYCGFNQTVRIFNISRPGRQCTVRVLKHKVLPDLCQKGIISCIAVNPTLNGVYACGSYRRTVGLYLEDGSVLCILEGHLGGVTHLSFSHDGSKLFTGGRKDSRLICWDMRNMGEEYQIFDRVVETNQRIYFEVSRNDRYLVSGGSDGCIRLWDLSASDGKSVDIGTSTDCVNGVSLNPFVPILATASGQRHFPDISEDGDSDDIFVSSSSKVNEAKEIKLWKFV